MTALTCSGLSMAFGGTAALSEVQLEVERGTVHAVLGENGAGKSTLMKILAGVQAPDAGRMTLCGAPYVPQSPVAARRRGVALVPQEPELADDLTVAENVLLGSEPSRWGIVNRRVLQERALSALVQVAKDADIIDPTRLASTLSPSDRQRVVIARALSVENPQVLIFDEPTSSLAQADVERLFTVITRLKERGLMILYVSHFLEEVMRIADSYTVLRDGRNAGSGSTRDTTLDQLVTLMAGRALAARPQRAARTEGGQVVLYASELSGPALPKSASFELHQGEILGIAGLVGAGRSELLRTVFGLQRVKQGQLKVGAYAGPASPLRRLMQGVGLLSEDRKGEGLALQLSIVENLVMSKRCTWGPLIRSGQEHRIADGFVQRLGIRCRDVEQPVVQLSGGNQQKVALARLLHHDVDVLMLDEPTRGIDVASRADVHRTIEALADRGKSVLLVSSYLPELLGVCDRIAVMSRGRLGPAHPVDDVDEHTLLKEAAGA